MQEVVHRTTAGIQNACRRRNTGTSHNKRTPAALLAPFPLDRLGAAGRCGARPVAHPDVPSGRRVSAERSV